jgi:hypothetical protein
MASSIPVALKLSDEPFHVEPFERCDVWAVTPALEPELPVRTMAGRYVVTHVPSGLQVCSYGVPLDEAFALYRLLTARFPSFEMGAAFGQKPESVELVRATHGEWREAMWAKDEDGYG